jgi:hypothetical protein
MNFLKPSLDKQVENELYLCERELLEAEGALEGWQSKVDMLRTRRARLLKRQGAVVRDGQLVDAMGR